MEPRPPLQLLAYETWEDASGLHARYQGVITDAAREAGVVEQVDADSVPELMRRGIANRIRAWSWEGPRRT